MPQLNLSLSDYRSEKGIEKWLTQMTRRSTSSTRMYVANSLRFFSMYMPTLPPAMALNFLLAMDLSRPVRAITLVPPEKVIAFRTQSESPFKLFYTRSGSSPRTSGINDAGRSVVRFSVRIPTPALESYTTAAIDVWTIPADGQRISIAPRSNSTGVMADGGGIQLLIPKSYNYLTVVLPPASSTSRAASASSTLTSTSTTSSTGTNTVSTTTR